MKQYIEIVKKVLADGEIAFDRTGVGTKSLFGVRFEHDLAVGFPLLTTKKVNFEAVVKELLWFLRGQSNIAQLGCGIWDAWASEDGECGPIYGPQWRGTPGPNGPSHGVDQIAALVNGLRSNPPSRRHIVSAWDVGKINAMALPPCHAFFQCYVTNAGRLDLQLYQRSADLGLGVPFNIASYAALVHFLCALTGLTPGRLLVTYGDVHIYLNHKAALEEQITRVPRVLPELELFSGSLTPDATIEGNLFGDVKPEHFKLQGYTPYPAIKLQVAV